jgi:uncharacterized protein (TIGR02266 family)
MGHRASPVEELLGQLRLDHALQVWQELCAQAALHGWTHEEFLSSLLERELDHRKVKGLHEQCKRARFPMQKTVREFDFKAVAPHCERVIEGCLERSFVTEGRALLLVGGGGCGKTHLAVAVAYQALLHGFSALYTDAAAMARALEEAERGGRWREGLTPWLEPEVLVVDDLDGEMLQEERIYLVLYERYLAGQAVILTTQVPPERWPTSKRGALLVASLAELLLMRGQMLFLDEREGDTGRPTVELLPEDLLRSLPPMAAVSTVTAPPTGPATDPSLPALLDGLGQRTSGIQERRGHRRHSVSIEVSASSEHNFFTGFCQDLSEGGLFLATSQLLPLGELIDLEFSLPGGKTIRATGVVRWHRTRVQEAGERVGYGVEFLALNPDDLKAIRDFFQQREPLFHV